MAMADPKELLEWRYFTPSRRAPARAPEKGLSGKKSAAGYNSNGRTF
jgi:hypothetical protein